MAWNLISLSSGRLSGTLFYGLTTLIVGLAFFSWNRRRKVVYKNVCKVKKLIIYPIKALAGFEVDHLESTNRGFVYKNLRDRSFLLINGDNVFVTQRQEPRLVLLKTYLTETGIRIVNPHSSSENSDEVHLKLDYDSDSKPPIQTKVWGDEIKGYECDATVSKWFQDYLGKEGIRLIRFTENLEPRPSRLSTKGEKRVPQHKIVYQDGAPCHLINEASIRDVNSRIEDGSVTYRNFRPNILIDTEPAFVEDNWQKIKIDQVTLDHLDLCTRCMVTTNKIDEAKFQKYPLQQLREYRKKENYTSPALGVFFFFENYGRINLNSDVFVSQ